MTAFLDARLIELEDKVEALEKAVTELQNRECPDCGYSKQKGHAK